MGIHEKISCIIPTYNEGDRIMGVLSAVLENEAVSEVIVVDDGSTDDTKKILEDLRGNRKIKLISYVKNRGKSFAVMTGLKRAKNELILMLDSDFVGLKSEDISRLITPVIDGIADMSIAMIRNSYWIYKLLGIDFVSGERVFYKKILGDLDGIAGLRGFGLETYINSIVVKKKLRLKVVHWKRTISPRKSVKFGKFRGTILDLNMVWQIILTTGAFKLVAQFLRMRALRVN